MTAPLIAPLGGTGETLSVVVVVVVVVAVDTYSDSVGCDDDVGGVGGIWLARFFSFFDGFCIVIFSNPWISCRQNGHVGS